MIRLIASTLLLITFWVNTGLSQGLESQEEFLELYNKAVDSLNTDLESADVYAVEAIRVAGKRNLWKAYFLKGLVCKKRNEYKQSIVFYERALNFTRDNLQRVYVINNIANSYFEMGKLVKAMRYCNYVLKEGQLHTSLKA